MIEDWMKFWGWRAKLGYSPSEQKFEASVYIEGLGFNIAYGDSLELAVSAWLEKFGGFMKHYAAT